MTPEWATIIGALLGAAAAITVSLITNGNQNKRFLSQTKEQNLKFLAEIEKQNALIVYRLEQLEEKVTAHNNYDRRIVALEEQVKTLFKHGGDAA